MHRASYVVTVVSVAQYCECHKVSSDADVSDTDDGTNFYPTQCDASYVCRVMQATQFDAIDTHFWVIL